MSAARRYAVVRCLSVCLSRSCIEHILKLYLNLSKQYSARRVLGELPDKGWNLAVC